MRVTRIQNTGTPNAGKDEAWQGPPLAAGGNAGGAAASEDGLTVPYKASLILTTRSSNHTPCIYPGELKTTSTPNPAHRCLQQIYP